MSKIRLVGLALFLLSFSSYAQEAQFIDPETLEKINQSELATAALSRYGTLDAALLALSFERQGGSQEEIFQKLHTAVTEASAKKTAEREASEYLTSSEYIFDDCSKNRHPQIGKFYEARLQGKEGPKISFPVSPKRQAEFESCLRIGHRIAEKRAVLNYSNAETLRTTIRDLFAGFNAHREKSQFSNFVDGLMNAAGAGR